MLSLTVFRTVAVVTAMLTCSAQLFAASEKEAELIALLKSDAAKGDKAVACKHLAVHGSAECVPELAKLLPDDQLSSWARIALEAIPDPAADEALRTAAASLEGRLLVGVLNSLGVRRDSGARELLAGKLADADGAVASAAAVALGQIGDADSAKALLGLLKTAPEGVLSAVAEGCILCAERALSEDRATDAVAIYDQVRAADVPRPRLREATRGAILARGEGGIKLLVEQLNSPDKDLFQIGLSTAREFPGKEVDAVLAKEMARAVPVRGALLLQAMADRPETVVLDAVIEAASGGAKEVRIAAVAALGRVGNAGCLSALLKAAVEDDEELRRAARKSLADLPGATIDQEVVKQLDKAAGKTQIVLLELVGDRRIDALPSLMKGLGNSNQTVRNAALMSLGHTVPPEKLSVLISHVASPQHAGDAEVAQLALKMACVRMPDRDACAGELATSLPKAKGDVKVALLEIIGAVGGTKALETVAAAVKGTDPALQDAGSKLLGSWMTADAAPVLLELARSNHKYKVRAQRGYFRIARQMAMPDEERMEMCRQSFAIAQQPAEQKVVLELYRIKPHLETLKLAVRATKEFPEELTEDATQTVIAVAQKLGTQKGEVAELLGQAGMKKVKLEIVKAQYGAGEKQKDVTDVLRKHAGELQLISLPAAGFNELFGGDPAPGTVKQLKVQYKLNDKPGEATFAEGALVILPIPK